MVAIGNDCVRAARRREQQANPAPKSVGGFRKEGLLQPPRRVPADGAPFELHEFLSPARITIGDAEIAEHLLSLPYRALNLGAEPICSQGAGVEAIEPYRGPT